MGIEYETEEEVIEEKEENPEAQPCCIANTFELAKDDFDRFQTLYQTASATNPSFKAVVDDLMFANFCRYREYYKSL